MQATAILIFTGDPFACVSAAALGLIDSIYLVIDGIDDRMRP